MFPMTNDRELILCGFGCEVKIYHDSTVKFADGSGLIIPRESDGSIHYCDILGPDDTIKPDPELQQDWVNREMEEIEADLSGLEFKNVRDERRKEIIFHLTAFPDFYNEFYLDPKHNPPYCLQKGKETKDISDRKNGIHVFELLGLFYQMDGDLEDAKKCFKLLLETANCPFYIQEKRKIRFSDASQKIKEINEEIHYLQENKEKWEILQPPQRQAEFTLEGVKIDNRKLKEEIDQFEEEDLHNFVLKKFPGKKLKEKLENTCVYNTDKKLYDSFKDSVEEEKNGVMEKQGTPLSYLNFGNKITIVSDLVKKSSFFMLLFIKSRRNDLSHADDTPEELKKGRAELEMKLNGIVRNQIFVVKDDFKNQLEK